MNLSKRVGSLAIGARTWLQFLVVEDFLRCSRVVTRASSWTGLGYFGLVSLRVAGNLECFPVECRVGEFFPTRTIADFFLRLQSVSYSYRFPFFPCLSRESQYATESRFNRLSTIQQSRTN